MSCSGGAVRCSPGYNCSLAHSESLADGRREVDSAARIFYMLPRVNLLGRLALSLSLVTNSG